MKFEKLLLNISTLGCHITMNQSGFRQKDVRFYAELFTNWVDVLLLPDLPVWHNTQSMRYLDSLCKKGWAKQEGEGKRRRYKLTRIGLLELVQEITQTSGYADIGYTLLIFYFLKSYKQQTISIIQEDGSGFSKAVQVEIEHIFDSERFLASQIDSLKLQIKRMQGRIAESQEASKLAIKLNRQGESVNEIIEKISEHYPYELDSQKPMNELLKEIAPEQRLWELTDGNFSRGNSLWVPQLSALNSYLNILTELKNSK